MNKIYLILTTFFFIASVSAQDYRSLDGRNNNNIYPQWGSSGTELLTLTSNGFRDSIKAVTTNDRPNPRLISNFLCSENIKDTIDSFKLTRFFWTFMQFVEHDIQKTSFNYIEPYSVTIPSGDTVLSPGSSMLFYRTEHAPGSGTDKNNPRKYINKNTSYIDASNIYGTDSTESASLRAFVDGKLKISENNLLPWNTFSGELNDQVNGALKINKSDLTDNGKYFYAADDDINNNPQIIALQTIFIREHNRLCNNLKDSLPGLSDEEIFQRARKKIIAYIQSIVYNEWLPIQGIKLPEYQAYNPEINSGISNLFSAILSNYEYTLQNEDVLRLDEFGTELLQGNLVFRDCFYNPLIIYLTGGIEPFINGMFLTNQNNSDINFSFTPRNFICIDPEIKHIDGASYNIFMSRERGLPDYNRIRQDFGLESIGSFNNISEDKNINNNLKFLYGIIDNIDAWIGLMSERRYENSIYGETMYTILKDQYLRLRDGDRYYFENTGQFSESELNEIRNTKLSDLVRRNTTISNVPSNIFTTKIEAIEYGPEIPENNLSVYFFPNPVTDKMFIKLWLEENSDINFKVFNSNGIQLRNYFVNMNKGINYYEEIDLTGFPFGEYFLLIETPDDHGVIKLIKK